MICNLVTFLGGLAAAALGARMAWPKDKSRIIRDLENSIGALLFVQRHLELWWRENGDPMDLAALQKVEEIHQAWKRIRSEEFEQGRMFENASDRD